jgi:hypothetical protein
MYPLPDRSYQRLSPFLITIPREAKLIACHCGAVLISEAKSIVLVMSRMASVITHNFYFFENRCYCNILVQLV